MHIRPERKETDYLDLTVVYARNKQTQSPPTTTSAEVYTASTTKMTTTLDAKHPKNKHSKSHSCATNQPRLPRSPLLNVLRILRDNTARQKKVVTGMSTFCRQSKGNAHNATPPGAHATPNHVSMHVFRDALVATSSSAPRADSMYQPTQRSNIYSTFNLKREKTGTDRVDNLLYRVIYPKN